MPTKKTIKTFGGENKPVIRRKKSTRRKRKNQQVTTVQNSPSKSNDDNSNHYGCDIESYKNEDVSNNLKRKRGPALDSTSSTNIATRRSTRSRKPLADATNVLPNQSYESIRDSNSLIKSPFPTKSEQKRRHSLKESSSSLFSTVVNDQITPKVNNRRKKGMEVIEIANKENNNNKKNQCATEEKQRESSDDSAAMDCSSDDESPCLLNFKGSSSSRHISSSPSYTAKSEGTSANVEEKINIHTAHRQWIDHRGEPNITKGMMKRLLNEKVENESIMKKLLSSQSCKDDIRGKSCIVKNKTSSSIEEKETVKQQHPKSNDIVGSDVMIHASLDDQSEVTADTALMQETATVSKKRQIKDKSKNPSISLNGLTTNAPKYAIKDDEYSVNTVHPELPPGWKVKLSRSKNRPYYVHPDHGATWYFPGRSGWKQMYSKTKNRSYYVHPDHGTTWFRPIGLENTDNDLHDEKIGKEKTCEERKNGEVAEGIECEQKNRKIVEQNKKPIGGEEKQEAFLHEKQSPGKTISNPMISGPNRNGRNVIITEYPQHFCAFSKHGAKNNECIQHTSIRNFANPTEEKNKKDSTTNPTQSTTNSSGTENHDRNFNNFDGNHEDEEDNSDESHSLTCANEDEIGEGHTGDDDVSLASDRTEKFENFELPVSEDLREPSLLPNLPRMPLQSPKLQTVRLRVRTLSSRVLLPSNKICSLQRLDEYLTH